MSQLASPTGERLLLQLEWVGLRYDVIVGNCIVRYFGFHGQVGNQGPECGGLVS